MWKCAALSPDLSLLPCVVLISQSAFEGTPNSYSCVVERHFCPTSLWQEKDVRRSVAESKLRGLDAFSCRGCYAKLLSTSLSNRSVCACEVITAYWMKLIHVIVIRDGVSTEHKRKSGKCIPFFESFSWRTAARLFVLAFGGDKKAVETALVWI